MLLWTLKQADPCNEAVVFAVDGAPAGEELQQHDAEGVHVSLLVEDAVRRVFGRHVPVHMI